MSESPDSVSLNKFISSTGICSRRGADELIDAGRVRLNGRVATKGNRVAPGDEVLLDGEPLAAKPPPLYLAYNKPVGVTSTTDRRDPTNIIDRIGHAQRLFPVGRLDKASQGLILLTNDGDIVNKILRAGNAHEKEYLVTVNKPITSNFLKHMSKGVPILGKVTRRARVEKLGERSFRIILTEGMNRQIRRMCEFLGYGVAGLKRIRVMNIRLGDLPNGQYRQLSPTELEALLAATRDSDKTAAASLDQGQLKKKSKKRKAKDRNRPDSKR